MPARNIVKTYVEDGIYHVYNRGVEKRNIFIDHSDYSVFLNILKTALCKPQNKDMMKIDITIQGATFKGVPRQTMSFYEKIELMAYCLMPNHFHMLLRQIKDRSMPIFFRSIAVRYAMYFNKKYHRVGQLFQSAYKGVMILDDDYLIHASRYIHSNPKDLFPNYSDAYSSYKEYIGQKTTPWLHPEFVLSLFASDNSLAIRKFDRYKDFVEATDVESEKIIDISAFAD